MARSWAAPSKAAQNLIQRAAEIAMDNAQAWIDELGDAVQSDELTAAMYTDPVLAARLRDANLSNMAHWTEANLQNPGAPVAPNLSIALLEVTRDVVRRDLDETSLHHWRLGQNLLWRRWMNVCFGLTSDAELLREVLAVTSQSMSTFVDETIAAVTEVMRSERDDLTQGTHAERLATVTLLLEGAPVQRGAAEAKLGYALTGPHLAAIVWGTGATGHQLEAAAEVVLRVAGGGRRLTVLATGASSWLWLPVGTLPRMAELEVELAGIGGVQVAVGRPRVDLDGFRRSHLEAAAVQRMMATLATPRRAGSYADAQLVALLSRDLARADEFIADVLGDLATADRDLQLTLRTYLEEQCNAVRVSEVLYTHRNTIIRRLARCDELLPRPLAENSVVVGAALQLLSWRG